MLEKLETEMLARESNQLNRALLEEEEIRAKNRAYAKLIKHVVRNVPEPAVLLQDFVEVCCIFGNIECAKKMEFCFAPSPGKRRKLL